MRFMVLRVHPSHCKWMLKHCIMGYGILYSMLSAHFGKVDHVIIYCTCSRYHTAKIVYIFLSVIFCILSTSVILKSTFSFHFTSRLRPSFIHEPVQPLEIKMRSTPCEREIDTVLRQCQNCLSGASWMGFLCRAAAHKLKITMQNGKCQVKYCEAHFYCTGAVRIHCLEWWFMLYHTAVWQMNLDLADVRWTLHAWMSETNCKVWWKRKVFHPDIYLNITPLKPITACVHTYQVCRK